MPPPPAATDEDPAAVGGPAGRVGRLGDRLARLGAGRRDDEEKWDSRTWAGRADAAEAAVIRRHVRRVWGQPGTRLGCVKWPPGVPEATFLAWHQWWQAHLVHCAVDSAARGPTPQRRRRVARLVRSVRARSMTSRAARAGRADVRDAVCTTLAFERAARLCGLRMLRGADTAAADLRARIDPAAGAIPAGRGGGAGASGVFEAGTNSAAASLLARLGDIDTAVGLANWIDRSLRDDGTGLVLDAVHGARGSLEGHRGDAAGAGYGAHSQGMVLGMEVELATHARAGRHRERACRSVAAVSAGMCIDGVIVGAGGGDGGLYAGILARALGAAACSLPGTATEVRAARDEAARLVLSSAEAAWSNRIEIDGRPLFGHDWSVPAQVPSAMFTPDDPAARVPEQDLSVQLSGWMLMEAAARVDGLA